MPIHVVAAVIRDGERVLVALRPPHKRHGSLWEFPGGKIDALETREEAVRREMREELGVEVLSVGAPQLSVGDPGSEFVIEFIPTEIRGTPEPLEHTELRWGLPKDLLEIPLAPSDRNFVLHLVQTAPGV